MAKRTTTHRERVEIIQLTEQGMSKRQIGQRLDVHINTVKRWRRIYREQGWEGLQPRPVGRPATGPMSSFAPIVRYVALRIKREHPTWGPDKVLLMMQRRASLQGYRLPQRSTLAAYWTPYLPRLGSKRTTVIQRPGRPKWPVRWVHACWEIDFKGAETIAPYGQVAPFLVVDALTSALLLVQAYPASRAGMTFRQVQADLRVAFTQWGLPDALRMDNDPLFIGSSRREWPGTLLLWLVGLGVTPLINDPGQPTQNAHVERQGRTWNQDVAQSTTCATLDEVQFASIQAQQERLYDLPSRNGACAGEPPMVAQPDLATPRRTFDPTQETTLFDFERVALYLADWVVTRLVDQTGCISVANQNVSVGRALHRQAVEVTFDLDALAFVVRTHDETRSIVRHFTLDGVSPAYIIGLD